MHDAFRNEKVHVCKKQCKTCIFRPGNLMQLNPGRVEQMVQDAINKDSAIICHDTLNGPNAVCRGFFDKYQTTPLQFAERLNMIEWE